SRTRASSPLSHTRQQSALLYHAGESRMAAHDVEDRHGEMVQRGVVLATRALEPVERAVRILVRAGGDRHPGRRNPPGLGLPLEPREELRGARRISARRMRGSEERVQEVHFAEQRYRGRDRRNGAVAVATAGERGTEQPLGEDRVGAQFDGRAPVSYGAGAV